MKRKIFSLIVVIVLLVSMNTFVLAEYTRVNFVPCELCGGPRVSSIDYSPWDYVIPSTIRNCDHDYTFGSDQKQYRIKTYHYNCLMCSYSPTHNVTEYRWLCNGFK